MYERRIMPFYMAYPMPMFGQQENTVMRDLEYMRRCTQGGKALSEADCRDFRQNGL